jgi:hypothetical protein
MPLKALIVPSENTPKSKQFSLMIRLLKAVYLGVANVEKKWTFQLNSGGLLLIN